MKKPTQILSDEHKNILTVIDSLLRKCDGLEGGEEINDDFFRRAIEFIRKYADKFHHAKEEDVLFVKISGHSRMHCDPTKQMLHEHEIGRGFVKGMEEALGKNDKKSLCENARGYGELLREHIFKEDNILYPMADEALSESEQKEMAEKFAQVPDLAFNEKEWN
ncbi:MAG: hemerythrin domain-containing protein [Candidatus Paceibacter sp.]|nr:hemerythrin domain-containing protein [Candidatus Paceibacter sp.]